MNKFKIRIVLKSGIIFDEELLTNLSKSEVRSLMQNDDKIENVRFNDLIVVVKEIAAFEVVERKGFLFF